MNTVTPYAEYEVKFHLLQKLKSRIQKLLRIKIGKKLVSSYETHFTHNNTHSSISYETSQ